METLQLAQMLADISDLSAAESRAANAMVNANKTLPTNPSQPPKADSQSDKLKPAMSRSSTSTPASRFDKFGRKILTPPPMSRTNSTGPQSRNESIPGTPRNEPDLNDDTQHATSLMALYEIRNKLKQQDSTGGLKKMREQVDAMISKRQQQQQGTQVEVQHVERPRPLSRTYTYPRSDTTATTVTTSPAQQQKK